MWDLSLIWEVVFDHYYIYLYYRTFEKIPFEKISFQYLDPKEKVCSFRYEPIHSISFAATAFEY